MSEFKSTGELELRIRELERIRNESHQAESELRANLEGLALLLRSNEALSRSLELDEILQTLTDSAAELLSTGSAAVYLLQGETLFLGATTPALPADFPDHLRRAPLADHPAIGRALASGEPVLQPDMLAEDLSEAERLVAESRDLRTVLHIPLTGSSETLGVYIVGSRGKCRDISDFETTLCRTLGTQAAIAIENARLFQSAREELAERKRIQEQLVQAQKMESVGRLAGGVAHDFNNMLNVIIGHAELELEDLPKDSPHREGLGQILDAALRSAGLTRQLLAFARKQNASPRSLDLNETVASMLKMLERLIGEDIELQWLPQHGLPQVHIDPGQIDQLLANLAVNARDAVETGSGRVTIRTGAAHLDAEFLAARGDRRPGPYVVLEVSDNGCGMDAATMARIFDPFFTTKEVGKGTGLGLSTVYGIAHQNGGLVDVHSEPNVGTRFRIYLPAEQHRAPEPIGKRDADLLPRGVETVLVVEDEESILHLTRTLLTKLGYEVLVATTPGEAITVVEDHDGSIDLLLADVVLPEMDGRRLAETLTRLRPGLRCLYVSGYTVDAIAPDGVLEEGLHFLQKPFNVESLARKVREALEAAGDDGPGPET